MHHNTSAEFTNFANFRYFFYTVSNLQKFGGFRSRLLLTDTDSVIISSERQSSLWERDEYSHLQSKTNKVLYHDTQIASTLASCYYRTQREVIDHSSLTPKSLVYRTHIKNDKFLNILLKYLSIRNKSSLFLYKDELQNQECSAFFSSSPKQVSFFFSF